MQSPALTIENISVASLDGRPLIKALHARFDPGVTALIGANGAGKSTLLRALAGLHPVAGGPVLLEGADSRRNRRAYLERLIFQPQNFMGYPDLTGQEFLEYSLRLRGARRRDTRAIAANWLDAVGLRHAAQTRTGAYSQGMRQRLGFAYAMQVNVFLYLLDEPFAGVDPESRVLMMDLLFRFCSTKIAIVSTHHLDEMANRRANLAKLSAGTLVTQCLWDS